MIKRDNAEIDMLLTGLLALSALIGGLHHWSLGAEQKNNAPKASSTMIAQKQGAESEAVAQSVLADASADEIFESLQPLIISNSVEKIIKLLSGVPSKTALSVLEKILSIKEENLDRDDRLQIIFSVTAQYKKRDEQYSILDLIINPKYLYLREGAPILALAALGDFPAIIPVIKAWYADRVAQQANHAELCEELESRALAYAVETNKLDDLKAMVANGVTMDSDRMSTLLVHAIKRKTGCNIIEFLLDHGADINYTVEGYTPLLWAIKNNDLNAVKFLVDHGADVNKIGDNKIGNPRQLASEAIEEASLSGKQAKNKKTRNKNQIKAKNDAVAIEAYLIEQGADN